MNWNVFIPPYHVEVTVARVRGRKRWVISIEFSMPIIILVCGHFGVYYYSIELDEEVESIKMMMSLIALIIMIISLAMTKC